MAKRGPSGTLMTRSRAIGPEQKALYHNDLGAGRGKVLREFVGLTAEDAAAVVDKVETFLQARLDDQFR